ncbi:MAG: hypothetical protein KKB03_05020 [Nanoarchaeota archaeon]|nr:hypothetical protein [Nanoarchaeota archaeon]
MTRGNLTKIGSWFKREVDSGNRKDCYFGSMGENEHGHVVAINGSPIYERYVSGAQYTFVSGALAIVLD